MAKPRRVPESPVPEAPPRKRTGLAWPCPANIIEAAHGDLGPVALGIKIDKRGCFYTRCSSCGTQTFFSREFWSEENGFTPAQVRGMGMRWLP